MPYFQKKPVTVEAHRWFINGDHPDDRPGETEPYETVKEGKLVRYYRTPDMDGEKACQHCGVKMRWHGWIDTLEGGHVVCPGDWIIKGVQGEFYPCKPDIFAKTYDEV